MLKTTKYKSELVKIVLVYFSVLNVLKSKYGHKMKDKKVWYGIVYMKITTERFSLKMSGMLRP